MVFDVFFEAVKAPVLQALVRHWRAVCGGKRMPRWEDINRNVIAPWLPLISAWRYDRRADAFTGRLAGEELIAVFGKSASGVPMKEFFAESHYATMFGRHRRVVVEPAFAHATGLAFPGILKHGSDERIYLPLAEDGTRADGVFAAAVRRPMGFPPAAAESQREAVVFFPLG